MSTTVLETSLGSAGPAPAALRLFARPALGFAGSTLLAVGLMILLSMI